MGVKLALLGSRELDHRSKAQVVLGSFFSSFFFYFVIIINIEFSKAWRGSTLCPWHCPSHHRDPCPLGLGCPRGALKVSQLAGLKRSLFFHGGWWQKIFVFRIQVSESRRLDNSIPTGLLRMLRMGIRVPSLKAGPSSSIRQILASSNIIIIKLFYNVIQTVLGQEQSGHHRYNRLRRILNGMLPLGGRVPRGNLAMSSPTFSAATGSMSSIS